MEAITLEDVVRVIGPNLEEDSSLLRYYDFIVSILSLLFRDENIEKAFQLDLSYEELVEYAKEVVISFSKNQITIDDIFEIKIIDSMQKRLIIKVNGCVDLDENAEFAIKKKMKIFTGYDVDIHLYHL